MGIYTLQHGLPIPVFDLGGSSLTCDANVSYYACPDRASFTGTPIGITNPRNNPNHLWFNPAAFTTPTLQFLNGQPATFGTLGTANRNPLYGPGINYGDMAIEKDIHISESKYFQLRFETYNTFNHTNFSNPANFGSVEDASGLIGNLGQIFSTKTITTNGEGRAVQLGAKFYF